MKTIALIPAAGVGSRFGANCPKQYVSIHGQTVLEHTVAIFSQNKDIDLVVVVVSPDDAYIDNLPMPEHVLVLKIGGATRAQTVTNAVQYLLQEKCCDQNDWVLVHDAARCGLPQEALARLLQFRSTATCGGLLALPVADTLKRDDGQGRVSETVSRATLWQAQTPQMFAAGLLLQALQSADLNLITDEASAIEALGLAPQLVLGDSRNMKLTLPQDEVLMALILQTVNKDT